MADGGVRMNDHSFIHFHSERVNWQQMIEWELYTLGRTQERTQAADKPAACVRVDVSKVIIKIYHVQSSLP